jgi:hypothetical protein
VRVHVLSRDHLRLRLDHRRRAHGRRALLLRQRLRVRRVRLPA